MTTVRTKVKRHIVEKLRDRLPEVQVDYGWPGKKIERDHVWIDRVTGTQTFPFVEAGTKTRDDVFTVRLVFQASQPGDALEDCDQRAERYLNEFVDMIAEDPSLGGMAELIHTKFDDNSSEGPDGEFTDQGAASWAICELTVLARIP